MKTITLIATCSFGLEAVVKRELFDLGIREFIVADGRVEFEAKLEDIAKTNLWLRCADRILVKLGECQAEDFDQLFDGVKACPWSDWIHVDAKITVIGKSVRSKLSSVHACQSVVKKALLEQMKQRHTKGIFRESGPESVVQFSLLKDVLTLTLDSTGLKQGLHKRGYRAQQGEAPIRENLAAALVLLSFWNKNRVLVDPMCGSGTILIEAAMIGRSIAPGLQRSFSSENWPLLNRNIWVEQRALAEEAIDRTSALSIYGYDIDPQRIKDCLVNAANAGVAGDIHFEVKDIAQLELQEPFGVLISNPPYGVKLLDEEEVFSLYRLINKLIRNKPGWSLYILTAEKTFPDFIQRTKLDRKRKLYSGAMEVHYHQYYGDKPDEA